MHMHLGNIFNKRKRIATKCKRIVYQNIYQNKKKYLQIYAKVIKSTGPKFLNCKMGFNNYTSKRNCKEVSTTPGTK